MGKSYAAQVHEDRLLLYMPDRTINENRQPTDLVLADGLPETAEYLHGMGLLNGEADRPSVIEKINGLTADDVKAVASKEQPSHSGHASVVFADVAENGAVLTAHAQSHVYELDMPEEAKVQ